MATSGSAQPIGIPGALKIVLFLLAVSIFINYIDRSNLSIAAPMLKDEFGLSSSQLGLLLAAFFVTYASFQLVSGWLVDRFNVNWVFAGGFFLWSAATAGTGMVHVFRVLFVLRLLLGIGESVAYPAYSKIIILNFPQEHRGFANSVISSGLLLGPGFGLLLGGLLMTRFGWRAFFIALGLASMLWLMPWLKWMPKNQATLRAEVDGAPSLLEFLGLRSAWGTCLGQFGINYVSYFLLNMASLLSGARTSFLAGRNGEDRRNRVCARRLSHRTFGLDVRPLDQCRRQSLRGSQNVRGRRACARWRFRRPFCLQ